VIAASLRPSCHDGLYDVVALRRPTRRQDLDVARSEEGDQGRGYQHLDTFRPVARPDSAAARSERQRRPHWPTAIDGVTTTHYRAIIDLSKVPNGNKIAQLTHVQYEPVDVWIGRDGLVRRMHLGYTVPAGSPGAGSVEMTMDLSRYGEPVYVSVPDASQTYDATDAAKNVLRP
jgi:hypothetical protein